MSTNRMTLELGKHVHIHSMLYDMVLYACGHIYHSMWQMCDVTVHPLGCIHHRWSLDNGYMWLVVYLPVQTTHPPRITGDQIDSHSSSYGYKWMIYWLVKSRNCQVVESTLRALEINRVKVNGQDLVRDRNTNNTVITYLTLCGVCCVTTWSLI